MNQSVVELNYKNVESIHHQHKWFCKVDNYVFDIKIIKLLNILRKGDLLFGILVVDVVVFVSKKRKRNKFLNQFSKLLTNTFLKFTVLCFSSKTLTLSSSILWCWVVAVPGSYFGSHLFSAWQTTL